MRASFLVSSVRVRAVLMGSLGSGGETTASSSPFDALIILFVPSSCLRGEISEINKMLCPLALSTKHENSEIYFITHFSLLPDLFSISLFLFLLFAITPSSVLPPRLNPLSPPSCFISC